MSNFRQFDRATGFLLPPSLDEWLPERHLARKPFGKAALGGHTGAAFLRDGGEAMVRCDDSVLSARPSSVSAARMQPRASSALRIAARKSGR